MSKYFLGLLGIFLASAIMSVGEEFEINLVRNGNFEPGMDRQGPRDWTPYYAPWGKTNIYEAGRGNATFTEEGMILERGQLYQLGDMKDDISPAYKFSCRMKTEGAKGASVEMRGRNVKLLNSALDVWEDLSAEVKSDGHYGFCVTITVPEGAKLHISSVKVTAALKPAADGGGQALISANDKDIPVRGILLPAEPNWFEQLAAHELRVNIFLISGAVLPVFAGESTDDKGYIRVASLKKMIPNKPVARETKSWREKVFGKQSAPVAEPEANGFTIICRDGNVELTGGNDAGVLAGAMHLSELLGAKFYAPRVYTIATNRTLKIPAMELAKHPAFEWTSGPSDQKQTLKGWKYGYLHPDSCIAPCEQASPPSGGWVHPPIFLAPPCLYAEEHPDFYALVKGKRFGDNTAWGYVNLCLSNPDLHKVIAERISRLMDLYPQCKYFSISQGDGALWWCQCEHCKALDVDENIWSDRLISYANAVAVLLNEKHPDRKLVVFAYGAKTEELPLKAKLHPNIVIGYATWPSSWPEWHGTVCEQNQHGLKLLDDWNAFTDKNLFMFLYPVNTYENAEKLKLFAEKGIKGFHQCGLRGDFPEITLYTTGRLIWDPDADVEKMIDEIMPHLYGEAAPEMRKYFDMHHALIKECVADPAKGRLYSAKHVSHYRLPLEYAKKALILLAQAENATDNDELLMKIHTEQHKVLFGYINQFNTVHPAIPDKLLEDYALKMAELVKIARKCRRPFAGHKEPFAEWLFQTTGGALDFDRGPSWFNDKKIDLFLSDPVKTLKTRVYFQEKITNGWELPPKAFFGSKYYEKYQGHPGVVIRRKSSSESLLKAYWRLNTLPANDVELDMRGMDNEKAEKAEISIRINNHEVFAGPVGFPKNKWGQQTYKVPREYLQTGENVIVIENITGDYKADMIGEAGPAEEALAKNYNWGWCIIGNVRFIGWNQ